MVMLAVVLIVPLIPIIRWKEWTMFKNVFFGRNQMAAFGLGYTITNSIAVLLFMVVIRALFTSKQPRESLTTNYTHPFKSVHVYRSGRNSYKLFLL